MYLIKIGPHQPILQQYPSTTRGANETYKHSHFNPAWFKEYPHLEYSLSKDAAFCFVCFLFGSAPGTEKADSQGRRSVVAQVQKLWYEKARETCNSFLVRSPQKGTFFLFSQACGHVDVLLDKVKRSALIQEKEDLQQNRRVIEILLDITKMLGRQGIAFRGHGSDDDGNFKQIVQLMAKYCPELRHWLNTTRMRPYHVTYLSDQSQNEFIELIGREVQQRIV